MHLCTHATVQVWGRRLLVGAGFLLMWVPKTKVKSSGLLARAFPRVVLPTQLTSLFQGHYSWNNKPISWYWHDTFCQLRRKEGSHQTGPKTLDFSASRTQNCIPDNCLLLLNYPCVEVFHSSTKQTKTMVRLGLCVSKTDFIPLCNGIIIWLSTELKLKCFLGSLALELLDTAPFR